MKIMYKAAGDYYTPMKLLIPKADKYNGKVTYTYPSIEEAPEENIFFGSFKTFGGTETTVNGIVTIVDTANIETFYRPDIGRYCRIAILETKEIYEVLGDPEDIERRHQILKFKVKKIVGGLNE